MSSKVANIYQGSRCYTLSGAMMRRIPVLPCCLLLALVIGHVAAYKEDFQNYGGDMSTMFNAGGGVSAPAVIKNIDPQTELKVAEITFVHPLAGGWAGIYYVEEYPAIKWTATVSAPAGTYCYFVFRDNLSAIGILAQYWDLDSALDNYVPHRYDFEMRNDNSIMVRRNGSYKDTIAPISKTPKYFVAGVENTVGGTQTFYVDDYAMSPTDTVPVNQATLNFIESIPPDYYVVNDVLNFGNNGTYNRSVGAVRTGSGAKFYTRLNVANNGTEFGAMHLQMANYNVGTVYENLYQIANCTNITGWNISILGSAPPGLYHIVATGNVYGDAFSDASSPFWLVGYGVTLTLVDPVYPIGGGGTNISFGSENPQYATGSYIPFIYTFAPGYYDPATYTYVIAIIGEDGTIWYSEPITGVIEGVNYAVEIEVPASLADDDYALAIVRTPIAGGTSTVMMVAPITVYSDVIIAGGTYEYTGVVIPNVTVNITKNLAITQHLSKPLYNQTGLAPYESINISANYTTTARTLWHNSVNFTPPGYGRYDINLYLTPDVRNFTRVANSAIYGFVKSADLNQPVVNATVYLRNATYSYYNFTNITGYYAFQYLDNTSYQMYSTADGYNNSILYTTNASSMMDGVVYNATRLDLEMEKEYHLRVDVKHNDAPSSYVLDPVTISVAQGTATCQTITNTGYSNFTQIYGVSNITATSTWYLAASTSTVMNTDKVVTLYLSSQTGYDVTPYTTPRFVYFHVTEGWGTDVENVDVNVTGISTSTGMWDWIATLTGIPLDEIPVNYTPMHQTTGSDGIAGFYVIPTAKYNVTFTKTGYTILPMVIVPSQETYEVTAVNNTVPSAGTFYPVEGMDELSTVKVYIETADYTTDKAWLNISYVDTSGHTTGGYINITNKSHTPFGPFQTYASYVVTGGSHFNRSIVIGHTQEESGTIYINTTHADFGRIERSYVWSFNSIPVDFLGFNSNIKMIVAFGIMILTAMLGGAASARAVSIAVCIEGWFFYATHMLANLTSRGIAGEGIVVLALVFMTVIAIAANIEIRKKKERY